jgi:Asp-tRNA(Asn)/Glu-tRNA(Gln) amidotransferase C subunit
LTDDELKDAVRYVNNFLKMADGFKELDLDDVPPFCFIETRECPLREDNPEPFAGIQEMLAGRVAGVDEGIGSLSKVPRIMEE